MPTTRNYARGRVWQDTERIAMTLRVPTVVHEQITQAALEREMTVNDLMLAILDHMLTPIGNTMRKIIQIVIDSDDDITALCDDGTTWIWTMGGWRVRFPAIPQDNPEE